VESRQQLGGSGYEYDGNLTVPVLTVPLLSGHRFALYLEFIDFVDPRLLHNVGCKVGSRLVSP